MALNNRVRDLLTFRACIILNNYCVLLVRWELCKGGALLKSVLVVSLFSIHCCRTLMDLPTAPVEFVLFSWSPTRVCSAWLHDA